MPRRDLEQQLQQRQGPHRPGVAAGLRALRDDRVHAGGDRALGRTATSETWDTTRAPAACACSIHPAGSPKDSDTTAGRSASDASSSSGRRSSIHTIRPIPNRPCGRASAACSAIHAVRGALLVTPIRPSPPAADTAPASAPPDHPPIGASTIG